MAMMPFHVPMAWLWLWFWGRLPFFDPAPWDYFVSALIASIVFGWVFYTFIERPMTLALNRRFAAPHSGDKASGKTA